VLPGNKVVIFKKTNGTKIHNNLLCNTSSYPSLCPHISSWRRQAFMYSNGLLWSFSSFPSSYTVSDIRFPL